MDALDREHFLHLGPFPGVLQRFLELPVELRDVVAGAMAVARRRDQDRVTVGYQRGVARGRKCIAPASQSSKQRDGATNLLSVGFVEDFIEGAALATIASPGFDLITDRLDASEVVLAEFRVTEESDRFIEALEGELPRGA